MGAWPEEGCGSGKRSAQCRRNSFPLVSRSDIPATERGQWLACRLATHFHITLAERGLTKATPLSTTPMKLGSYVPSHYASTSNCLPAATFPRRRGPPSEHPQRMKLSAVVPSSAAYEECSMSSL